MEVLNPKIDVEMMNTPIVINLFGGPCCGKCFRRGTKVLTFSGKIMNVEDIKVGDKLIGPNGKPRIVLYLSSGKSELFEIKPVSGESHYVTGNHVLPLKLNHHGVEKDELYTVNEFINLSEWRKRRLKLYRSNCLSFKYKKIPIDPYFIGCWLGDGNNANQGITSMDDNIINYLKKLAHGYSMKLTIVTKTGTDAVRCDISNGRIGGKPNKVLNILRKLNLIHNKHIPMVYKINNKKNRLKLLAGLIDSDGHMSNNSYEIITKYKTLADDILFVCRSLGFSSYISEKEVIGNIYYRVSINGYLDNIPVLLSRKKIKKHKKRRNVLRTGLSIKSIGDDNFYGFEVDKDHKFLLSDFTVTHNSTTAAAVFSLLKLHGVETELITEFAKDLVWEERFHTFKNQYYLFGKQQHRLWRVSGKVDVMVTDSPIFLSVVYKKELYSDAFRKVVIEEFNSYNNMNFFLNRTKSYNEVGRNQNEKEAKLLDREIIKDLDKHNIDYFIINSDVLAPNLITERVLHLFNKEIKIKLDTVV